MTDDVMQSPTGSAGDGPSPLRGEARENAILDAAIALIAEVGYERVTVDAIAARARSSKTTMYKRWPGKPELVADALRRRAQRIEPFVPDTGSLRGDLLGVVGQISLTLTGGRGPSLIGMLEAIRDDSTLRGLVASQVRERSHEVGRVLCGRAAARGERVDVERSGVVMDIAFAQLFTDTLFGGRVPDAAAQEILVDEVLVPLLRLA